MATPQRIVSLVPSLTELLHHLGLGDRVVGITKFCVHPAHWQREKTRIGGTKTVNIAKVAELRPDFILANKEENDREQVEALQAICPVLVTEVKTLEDALAMIAEVGTYTGTQAAAAELVHNISAHFAQLSQPTRKSTAAYLIWRKPYMAAGGDTFIHDMLGHAGFSNVFADQLRYPAITILDLQAANPEYILLSSEPFPFSEKHIAELREICPNARIKLVDGELYSWYGPRMLEFGK